MLWEDDVDDDSGYRAAFTEQGSSASQAGSSGNVGYRARYAVSVQTRERMSDTPRLSSRRPKRMELACVRAQPLVGMPLSRRRTVCLASGASRRCVPYRTHESPSNQLLASTSWNRREESRSTWRDFSMFGTQRQILQHTAPSPSSSGRSAVKIHRSLVNWENQLTAGCRKETNKLESFLNQWKPGKVTDSSVSQSLEQQATTPPCQQLTLRLLSSSAS